LNTVGAAGKREALIVMGIPDFSYLPVTIRRLKFGKRQTIEIQRDLVRVTEKGLFATKWSEPVSAFKGVLVREIMVGGGRYSSPHVCHLIELVHPDKDKTLLLYKTTREEEMHKLREDAACALDLPLLDKIADGIVARAPEDLHKSVRDLAAEEKISVDFDPDAPPPTGIMWKHVEGELHVTLTVWATPYGKNILFFLGWSFAMLLIWQRSFEGNLRVVVGILGALIVVLYGGFLLMDGIAKRRILITPSEFRCFRETPFGTFGHKSMPLRELKSVRRNLKGNLVMESGTASVSIDGVGKPELLWLERFILAATINPPS
jgi:hypothetical protein